MNNKWALSVLIATALLLTGGAAAKANAGNATASHLAPNMTMSPGMTMSSGVKMAAAPSVHTAVDASSPSKSASMICGPETAKNVATLMGLHTPAPTKATWADHLYTCTYRLPNGPLVLSVKQSTDARAARGYFGTLRDRLGGTTALTGLAGLGLPAYQNTTGSVVFLKDNMTLQVDATALPSRIGEQNTSRTDLAYTIATDILACWTGK